MSREQPLLFREATNPSFLTALTNAFAINARNIEYLKMMVSIVRRIWSCLSNWLLALIIFRKKHENFYLFVSKTFEILQKLITSETEFGRTKIINRLYLEALEDFVKLPFDFAVDIWRFHIFDGTSTNTTWNSDWWQLRQIFFKLESVL